MFELRLENSNANIVDLNDGERYEVISVSGLNPPSASLFTSKSPNRKGLKHNGSSLNERIVVLQIKLLGNVEESRNALYSWVDPEQYAKIYYSNGAKSVYCEGYVEACEVDMFSDNEVMNVEILCGNPYWKDMQEMLVEISNVLKQFIFAFAIDSAGIPFSTLKESNVTSVFNSGAETGVQFIIRCTEPITSLVIFDADNTANQFNINRSFAEGWQIIIDTDASPKICRAIDPNGASENILRYVKGNPTWFTLRKGINRFGYIVGGAAAVEMTVGFTNKYLGV
jgi:hypothetical protein